MRFMDSGDIGLDPLARAVLRKLETIHPKDAPLGSFARTVLTGEASLHDAARHPWHGQALSRAFTDAELARRHLSEKERAEIEKSATRLGKAHKANDDGRESADSWDRP
jgi:hypothetical protein